MKTALLFLAALAVASGPAQALRCHVCTSSTNCEKPQVCSVNSNFCKTVTKVEPLSGNLVEKDCAESCTPTHNLQGQVSRGSSATLCCRGDLCNDSLQSAAPARALLTSAPLGLALALGLLALTWAASL
ncbi:lymphocyte antigen 6D [Neophocaena asiaeorientalis asiaeorientalis]|uniref:Lymphocyte antigen 6D n=2 Tax=Phocoenidae TaxID=9740 RepID=A0A341B4E4_NEOAA|nr:lymphocyte antigen 6D [Neophocaena asiaeorientalis asiaeorientalis]XP_032466112.1 lymphocyte antigen 6D [Phocoena sinus]